MCNYIVHKKIKKDQFAIQQKDKDNVIMGILNGHFSILQRENVERSIFQFYLEKALKCDSFRSRVAIDKEHELRVLNRWDCIGELDLFSDKCIKHSAKAIEDSEIFILSRDVLKKNFYV